MLICIATESGVDAAKETPRVVRAIFGLIVTGAVSSSFDFFLRCTLFEEGEGDEQFFALVSRENIWD